MNVLSLFDGMSCGRLALDRAGIKVDKYYASEVDKYAIKISEKNYPDIVHLGDINGWKDWPIDFGSVDLILAGSPCQGFSFAGKGLNFDDPRSALFFVFVDILNYVRNLNPDVKFLLENVRMKKEFQAVISELVGVEPVMINSALVSAQNRVRLYWTNISDDIPQPEDRGILLKDVLETPGEGVVKNRGEMQSRPDKALILDANYYKGPDNHGQRTCIQIGEADIKGHDYNRRVYSPDGKGPSLAAKSGGNLEPKVGVKKLADESGNYYGGGLFDPNGKSPTLSGVGNGGGGTNNIPKVGIARRDKDGASFVYSGDGKKGDEFTYDQYTHWRKLTPLECERLQTVPDGFSGGVSNTQRYKMLGNGWTVDVIAHIFQLLRNPEQLEEE